MLPFLISTHEMWLTIALAMWDGQRANKWSQRA
jgi:hypothetical protein